MSIRASLKILYDFQNLIWFSKSYMILKEALMLTKAAIFDKKNVYMILLITVVDNGYLFMWFTFTFTFMHLADAFIQSDLQCIQVTVSTFYQLLLSLGIEPMILALLAPCSTSWATGKLYAHLYVMAKLTFQHPYSCLQCHRNHSNMFICCSRNISYYYQCWKCCYAA